MPWRHYRGLNENHGRVPGHPTGLVALLAMLVVIRWGEECASELNGTSRGSGACELLGAPVERQLDEGFARRSEESEPTVSRDRLGDDAAHLFGRLLPRCTVGLECSDERTEGLA